MRILTLLVAATTACLAPALAAAEPVLEQAIVATVEADFQERLSSPECAPYFRYASSDLRNWARRDKLAKVEIVFYVGYVSDRALYGTAARTVNCLGRRVGEGFFVKGDAYITAVFVYTLSLWEKGWRVDRIEFGPAPMAAGSPPSPSDVDWLRPAPLTSARDLYNRGVAHFTRGDYAQAIADYSAAIAADPTMALAYNNRCLARVIIKEDLVGARADCQEAVKLLPNDPQVRETQGLVRLLVNDPRNAVVEYDAALKVAPHRAVALFGRGVAKARLGNSKGSEADKAAALKFDASVERIFATYGVR